MALEPTDCQRTLWTYYPTKVKLMSLAPSISFQMNFPFSVNTFGAPYVISNELIYFFSQFICNFNANLTYPNLT